MNRAQPRQLNNTPTILVVFGFSRRDITDAEFRRSIREILTEHKNKEIKKQESFSSLFSYHKGAFDTISNYKDLASVLKTIDNTWGVCANKLFYLAAPPQFYAPIFKNLASSGLTKPCSPEEGWTRVIAEKPFGKDSETANALEKLLSKLFQEIQIYRIDHYLAKEMLQNILAFRFSNNLFEQSWNKDFVEKIEIRLWEKLGVENRGSFYDSLRALRDVGQNHLLQMLALVTMEHPIDFSTDTIRRKREELLRTLIASSEGEVKDLSFRAQYDGYRTIPGVTKDSTTETYFKIRAFLSSPKWQDVPIISESGKRLKKQLKEIIVIFKHPAPCLCPSEKEHYKNRIIIRLEPKEQIIIQFWSKKPGLAFEIEEHDFSFLLRDKGTQAQYTEEYEKLLLDCIAGDQTLFTSSAEIKAMWRFIDPIIKAWQDNNVPLQTYKPDTDEPIIASHRISDLTTTPFQTLEITKQIGIVGLGRMGGNLAQRLVEKKWKVAGYNIVPETTKALENKGLIGAYSLEGLVKSLPAPRLIWLMVPAFPKASAGKPAVSPVDGVLFGKGGLISYLEKGDIVIDGGNSFYKDSVLRFKKLQKKGIHFIDVGVSGGPEGARRGASLMIGGEREIFQKFEPLFYDLAVNNGYQFFEGAGAGHFVKMVHNGIEYGMMQAIAEGFAILKKTEYKLNLAQVAEVYNNGGVIESRLVGWLKNSFDSYGNDLKNVSGSVGHTGEGAWTVRTAKEEGIKAKIIEEALKFRIKSERNPSYTGKILSALREQFGGHSIKIE